MDDYTGHAQPALLRRWVTLFPEAENFHLTKDVGMIPYLMHQDFGYESVLVCRRNGAYPYLAQEVRGLKLEFLDSSIPDPVEAGCAYIKEHAQNIDVLHLFHANNRTYRWLILFHSLNPRGKVYLKLDALPIVEELDEATVDLLTSCQLVSIEIRYLYERLKSKWPVTLGYIPNGFYDHFDCEPVSWAEKENTICTIGRIGTLQKANEFLLEAFRDAAPFIPGWKLKLIGPIDLSFFPWIDQFFAKNPHLTRRVVFTGEIVDKRQLDYELRKAKVFCLTSRFESFGIVLVEAIKNGCLVLSSKVGAAADVTANGRFGDIFEIGDIERLTQLLIANCTHTDRLNQVCREAPSFAQGHFSWKHICTEIETLLMGDWPHDDFQK